MLFKSLFARFGGFVGKHSAVQPGANDQIIMHGKAPYIPGYYQDKIMEENSLSGEFFLKSNSIQEIIDRLAEYRRSAK